MSGSAALPTARSLAGAPARSPARDGTRSAPSSSWPTARPARGPGSRPASRRPARRLLPGAALGLAALAAAGCASRPIEIDDDAVTVEPVVASQVVGNPDLARGTVLWGGTIIGAANLESGSQLELLAYPLDRTQRPQVGLPSQGRFVVTSDDYLETVDYAEGRQVTVLGNLDGLDEVRIGDASRELPVVRASQLHLWSGAGPRDRTGVSFGIGLGSGGRTSGGIGIGIGN